MLTLKWIETYQIYLNPCIHRTENKPLVTFEKERLRNQLLILTTANQIVNEGKFVLREVLQLINTEK